MSDPIKTNVSKLLRVLVAGGVALAGVARAEEKAPPAETADQAKEKAKAADAKDQGKSKDASKDQKKAKEKKPAESDGGGVKGW